MNISADVRELGRQAEYRVMEVLNGAGFSTRHADRERDLRGVDLEIDLFGHTLWLEITISRRRLAEKQVSNGLCRNGLAHLVIIDTRWSDEELLREVLRQIICSLPERTKRELLSELQKVQGLAGS